MEDTIAALSTPAGEAALAVIRASGPACPALVKAVFPKVNPEPRRVQYALYHDAEGAVLDDVVFTWFARPASYTGEDMLEISSHGNPFIVRKILADLYRRGARPAEPGEFTRRAFLNGRLDLSQAEAVGDLIRARSDRALDAARNQLAGILGRAIGEMSESLLSVIARLEAYIDFPEEDLPPEDTEGPFAGIQAIRRDLDRLYSTNKYGKILREGLGAIIIGAPNAGKSSLLNSLLGRERAIVSEEAGTTRDFLEESIVLGGHRIRVLDTAGLRCPSDGIENLGMDKTLEVAGEAELFLRVVDGTLPCPELPAAVAGRLHEGNALLVRNKADLFEGESPPPLPSLPYPTVDVSALTGEGMDALEAALCRLIEGNADFRTDHGIAVSARHARSLERALAALDEAIEKYRDDAPVELIASDLRLALDAMGEIAGKIDNERMLDKLFAEFCIGK